MKAKIRCVLGAVLVSLATTAFGQTYNNPESVEYHPRLDRHLVGNSAGGGTILARAADGTLSVFTADPASPYGIELLAGTLFVLDSGQLKGYDIDTAAPVVSFPVVGAAFLNGITSNGVDTLYVSDFSARRIHTINVANLAAPVLGTPVVVGPQPNGLVFDRDNNRLLIATWGSNAKVLSLDLAIPGATPTELINTTLTSFDGIALDCNGSIVVSAWNACGASGSPTGCLRRFDAPFTLGSTPQVLANNLGNPADIDYTKASGQIAVPESSFARVTLVDTACEGSLFGGDFER